MILSFCRLGVEELQELNISSSSGGVDSCNYVDGVFSGSGEHDM